VDTTSFFQYPTVDLSEDAREVLFLPDASQDDWSKLLAHTETRSFRSGDTVIRQGEVERALYLLTDGRLEVERAPREGKASALKVIEAPTVVGEMSFLDSQPRSATLRALTDGRMLRLSIESFDALAAREPRLGRDVLFELGRILAYRLRLASDFIADWIG
jgi:CRP/FNR family transcriptional regulator, cyclic AMP receptor protein